MLLIHPDHIDFPITAKGAPLKARHENLEALLAAYGITNRVNLMRNAAELTIPLFDVSSGREANATLELVLDLADRWGLGRTSTLSQLTYLAEEYHPAWDWIRSDPWDGTSRIADLFGTLTLDRKADADLCRVLVEKWLVSAVKACKYPRQPGDHFTPQGVMVLQGPQGIGKTQWFKSLQPRNANWVLSGQLLDPDDRDSVQQATSFWITELGELDSTYKKADIAALKAFVTKEFDTYRSAYAKREECVPRRTVFGASVNPQVFLVDDTGNRRWWTVPVVGLDWNHGINTQQLWAEVATMVAEDVPWWLTPEEHARLDLANEAHRMVDPLVDDLWECFQPNASGTLRYTLSQIWETLPGRKNKPRNHSESMRLGNALRAAGVENETVSNGTKTYNVCMTLDARQREEERGWGR